MKKFILAAALAIAALPIFGFATPVFADSPGQLASGPDLYQVRNVTQNGAYGSSVSAQCNETIKFSVKLANSEYGQLDNVTVKASLTSGSMTASATNAASQPTSATGNVTVNLAKGSLVYITGSTKNLDVNGTLIKTLPDGVTTTGVNKGTLKGSTREFVQFEAKVHCETPPPVTITVCELATKKIVTINENAFDPAKYSKNLADCAPTPPQPGNITVCEISTKKIITIKETDFNDQKYTKDLAKCAVTPVAPPTSIPNTGAGAVMGIAAAVSAIGAIAHRVWTVRRMQ